MTPGNYFVTIERDFSNAIFQKRKQNFFASSFWKLCCGQIVSGLQMDSILVVRPTNFINNSIHYEVSGVDPHICFVLYISMQKHYSTKTVQDFDNGNCNVSTSLLLLLLINIFPVSTINYGSSYSESVCE